MSKWIPDRKFIASGIAGILTWIALTFLSLPEEVATAIVGGVMAAVHYFVPPSVGDLIKRADDFLKTLGKDGSDTAGV